MLLRVFFLLLLLGSLSAQDLAKMRLIGKPYKSPDEFVAKRDVNGRYCAGIKVISDMDGFSYQANNGVVAVDDEPGQDLVYLQPDERVLEIYHSGYQPLKLIFSEQGIHIGSRQVWVIKVGGAPKVGDTLPVTFLIQPAKANVIVDGISVSTNKPVDLSIGKHRLKITSEGFRTVEKEIYVDKNHVLFNYTMQEVDLVPVAIKSIPQGAEIYIDGIKKGITDKGLNLFPGKYNLRLLLSGYTNLQKIIEVKENQNNTFNFKLEKNAGLLVLSVVPSNAQVLINKEDYSGQNQIELAPGVYRVEINAQGYYGLSENITISLGQTLRKSYVLKQKMGKLNFSVTPVEAKVILKKDGKVVKQWQGAAYLKNIGVGKYNIEVVANGYISINKKIYIKQNHTTILDYTLKKGTAYRKTIITPSGIEMVYVAAGTFQMGDTWGDGESDEKPVHSVTMSGFYMGKYEVTNAQVVDVFNWALAQGKIMASRSIVKNVEGDQQKLLDLGFHQIIYNGNELYTENNYDDYPVIGISWYGAVAFCNYLSEREGLTPVYNLNNWTANMNANGYRLPTEAEWEYAARGGNESQSFKYSGSSNVDAVAWYGDNSNASGNSNLDNGQGTLPVGSKQPNELGIYDMSGNVWEWCWDWYVSDHYSNSLQDNPKGPARGSVRVLRGGSWNDRARYVRVAYRFGYAPSFSSSGVGFRILRRP